MPIRIVQSKQNDRLKQLRRALARPAHKPARDASTLVALEGPNLVEEALRAGLAIDCLFLSERFQPWLQSLALPANTETLLVPKDLLASILTTENPQLVAALVHPFDWTWRDLLEGGVDGSNTAAPLLLILAGLQDPGNLGAILRSAEAFGASGVIALPGTVSAWNPKTIRASAGSVLRVPFLAVPSDECFARLREAHIPVLATVPQSSSKNQLHAMGPVALLIGNEGNGVPADLAAKTDGVLTIPCPGPVESLNAAVAASILLYEASRQRLAHSGGPLNRLGAHR
ncbi:MAG TPA: RNA methyltransferase [Terracidiphilus sp.]|nr:RNA methyltransferase [Terracidiphilus sp.]